MKVSDSEAKHTSDAQAHKTGAAGAPPWRRLLAPVDFSASSDAALLYAVQLARVNGATLHVCHAIPHPHMLDALFERGLTPEETVRRIHRKGRHHVRQLLASVGVDVSLRFHFHEGEAVAAVLAWVDKLKPDLIVMGTHGHRGAARFFLGSVAEAVVRQAPCPVLTLRATQA